MNKLHYTGYAEGRKIINDPSIRVDNHGDFYNISLWNFETVWWGDEITVHEEVVLMRICQMIFQDR
jgi:hypothetical protein